MWTIIAIIVAIKYGVLMKTIQMTLDEDLLREVDKIVKKLKTTRSGFARHAFKVAINDMIERGMELKQQKGYIREHARSNEFGIWESEQVWIEE